MNILFVCHRIPFPPNHGGKIRAFHFIRHLSRRHTVVVASLAASTQELEASRGLSAYAERVLAEIVPPATRWRQAGASVPTGTPSSVAYFSSTRLHRRIVQLAQDTAFDAVIVHCAFVAHHADDVPARLRLLDFCDLDSAKWSSYARHRRPPLAWLYALEATKLRRYERRLALGFDRCTVATPGELDEFDGLGVPGPCTVVPNGVDLEYFRPTAEPRDGRPRVLFLGRMDYFPNIDAAVHLAETIFPLVRQRIPAAQLQIVGANPARAIRRLRRLPGVQLFADVPDVRPFLCGASVSVAPLRIARGTQNKILESMAAGLPVVASPEAAKGIQAVAGNHLLVASAPSAFAGAIAGLLEDPAMRVKLAEAGRLQVSRAHDWGSTMTALDQLLETTGRP